MTLLLQLNLGFAWGASGQDTVTPWIHHQSLTSFNTHASGYTSAPTVIRNTDVHQAYQADIDE